MISATSANLSPTPLPNAAKPKVMVGLSGGVDSAVAALILKQQGYRVSGLFMKNWEADDGRPECTVAADLTQAAAVADHLEIPLHTAKFSEQYQKQVFAPFLNALRQGKTPNPDVLCNRNIKFTCFAEDASRLGADLIATGHYARIGQSQTGAGVSTTLLTGIDSNKDQSYFLHALAAQQLKKVLFPLGSLHKKQVREMARAASLPNWDRPDSVGICFIGKRNLQQFLRRWLPEQPGTIISCEGDVIGRHRGLDCYTIGQRQGLGIGGRSHACQLPWYVVAKDIASNRLVVAQGQNHPLLYSKSLKTASPHWISGTAPKLPMTALVRVRHRQLPTPCQISMCSETSGLGINFDLPQRALAPGQYAVIYRGSVCLGGAEIVASDRTSVTPIPAAQI